MKKNMTYEEAVIKLEDIVKALEKNNLPLENSIKLFQEGTELTAYCSKLLNEAEQKITILSTEDLDVE